MFNQSSLETVREKLGAEVFAEHKLRQEDFEDSLKEESLSKKGLPRYIIEKSAESKAKTVEQWRLEER